jgi:thiol:disulfide interchange protein DsbA
MGKLSIKFAILFSSILLVATIVGSILAADYAQGQEPPFPAYGSGKIEVRIYTDYFCAPCQGMEPALEPFLRDLVKNNVIRVTLVDTPFSRTTLIYAKYFLYALTSKNDLEQALKVRNLLFDTAAGKNVTTKEGIEELFKNKGILYTVFDPKVVFDRFNTLFKEDRIDATPSCVIVKGGKKETFVGGADIINALKGLK